MFPYRLCVNFGGQILQLQTELNMSTSSSSIESFVCVPRDACVMVRRFELYFIL